LSEIEPGDCLVVFSRKKLFDFKKKVEKGDIISFFFFILIFVTKQLDSSVPVFTAIYLPLLEQSKPDYLMILGSLYPFWLQRMLLEWA